MVRSPWLLPLCLTVACAAAQARVRHDSASLAAQAPSDQAVPHERHTLASAAAAEAGALVGRPSLRDLAPQLPDDCTGVVRYLYERQGVSLLDPRPPGGSANGVTAIYQTMRRRGAVHRTHPRPGDLAFFRETYDRNRDGHFDDGLTHVAIVESVAGDGQLTLVHRGSRGITRVMMDLSRPHLYRDRAGEVRNDFIRRSAGSHPGKLTAELFVAFATPRAPGQPVLLARGRPGQRGR